MKAEQELDEFCRRLRTTTYGHKNQWLEEDRSLHVYVRKAHRILDNRTVTVLDIGNIEADPQGEGRFTDFLEHAEKTQPWDGLYIENVQSERFCQFFESRGYKEYVVAGTSWGMSKCYFRLVDSDQLLPAEREVVEAVRAMNPDDRTPIHTMLLNTFDRIAPRPLTDNRDKVSPFYAP